MIYFTTSILAIIISFLGPIVLNSSLTRLHSLLNFNKEAKYAKLKELMNDNTWVYAVIDYNTQLHVTLIAWVALFFNVIILCVAYLYSHYFNELISTVENSIPLFVFVVCLILLFIAGIYLFLMNHFSTPKLIALYKPETLPINNNKFPPFKSIITWLRGAIIACGAFLIILKQYVL